MRQVWAGSCKSLVDYKKGNHTAGQCRIKHHKTLQVQINDLHGLSHACRMRTEKKNTLHDSTEQDKTKQRRLRLSPAVLADNSLLENSKKQGKTKKDNTAQRRLLPSGKGAIGDMLCNSGVIYKTSQKNTRHQRTIQNNTLQHNTAHYRNDNATIGGHNLSTKFKRTSQHMTRHYRTKQKEWRKQHGERSSKSGD